MRFGQRWFVSLTDVLRIDPGRSSPWPRRPHHLLPFEVVTDYAEQLDLALDPINVDMLVAVVRGLRHAVCAIERPMALARAHAILAHVLALMPRSASPRSDGDLTLF